MPPKHRHVVDPMGPTALAARLRGVCVHERGPRGERGEGVGDEEKRAIVANTAKVGITEDQKRAIEAAKVPRQGESAERGPKAVATHPLESRVKIVRQEAVQRRVNPTVVWVN